MVLGNRDIQPIQSAVPNMTDTMNTVNQALASIMNRIEAIERALASVASGSDSDTTESGSDAASDRFSIPHSRAPTMRSTRIHGGINTRSLLCVTAIEGDKSFGLVMARKDLSGVNPGHHSPQTVSSTQRYENVIKKLVRELWPRETKVLKDMMDGPYYKIQRHDLVPPYHLRNKRYHMECAFSEDLPWPHPQSGYLAIDPRAWDIILHAATSIRIVCKDLTSTHGATWIPGPR